ncbi:MAG: hypothetical protein QE263_00425 [Vampirovibrionales bacterium]|nr:hypothetical protein [Vampirovibrionales bacterium]
MFFTLLCLGLWALVAFKVPTDLFGWLMLVGAGWVFGFLDGRRATQNHSDAEPLPHHLLPNE